MATRRPRAEQPDEDPIVLMDEKPLPDTQASEPSSEEKEEAPEETQADSKEPAKVGKPKADKHYLITSGSFLWVGLGANVVLYPGTSAAVTEKELEEIGELSQSQLAIKEIDSAEYAEIKKQSGMLGYVPAKQ